MNLLKRLYRSATTGRWITRDEAERTPHTTVCERIEVYTVNAQAAAPSEPDQTKQ